MDGSKSSANILKPLWEVLLVQDVTCGSDSAQDLPGHSSVYLLSWQDIVIGAHDYVY